LAAPLQAKTSGAQHRPNSETTRDDGTEQTESGAADKENEHEFPESKNKLQESAHDRNAPDDQDDGSGCIYRAHDMP
jgi:hypothetical protein